MMIDEYEESPNAIGSPRAVLEIAIGFLNKIGARKVLDCPAGEGPFTRMLLS